MVIITNKNDNDDDHNSVFIKHFNNAKTPKTTSLPAPNGKDHQ